MDPNKKQLSLLYTIVDRDKGQMAVDTLLHDNLLFHKIMLGRGTARTEILNVLGLGRTQKDIVMSILPTAVRDKALRRLRTRLEFQIPGHGIAFTVPINAIGGLHMHRMLDVTHAEKAGEEQPMNTVERAYDMVLAMVAKGHADDVMDAARHAGATGGTILAARGAGIEDAETFFNITIQPEREVLLILLRHDIKRAVMEAIMHCKHFGKDGLVIGLPAEDVIGLHDGQTEDDEE